MTSAVISGAAGTAPAAPGRLYERPNLLRRRRRNFWSAMTFIGPWIFGFVLFTAWPMIYSLYLSMTNFDNINAPRWVGFANYQRMMEDPRIPRTLMNTFQFAIMSVPAQIIVAVGLAMLLHRATIGTGFFRTTFFLPRMTPPVAVGVLFLLLFNGPQGIINRVLSWVGITGPNWTVDGFWVRPGLVIMSLWTVGGTALILLAALKDVPKELYESASIDGASKMRQFWKITIPLISPQIFFVFIVNSIGALQSFTEAYTAFFGGGSDAFRNEGALFYSIHLFEQAFRFFRMGYASAMAWVLFVIIMIITAIQFWGSRRFVFYEGDH